MDTVQDTLDCSDDSIRVVSKEYRIRVDENTSMVDAVPYRSAEVFLIVGDEYILVFRAVFQQSTIIRPLTKNRIRFLNFVTA